MSQMALICFGVSENLNPSLADTSYMVCLYASLFSNFEYSESGLVCLSSLFLYDLHDSYGYGGTGFSYWKSFRLYNNFTFNNKSGSVFGGTVMCSEAPSRKSPSTNAL